MSGAAVATRATAQGAHAAAQASRKGWLESLKDEAVSFVKGDNNAPWAILAETVIGCVPVLGQIVDARDIIKGLVEVAAAPASPLAWFNLITALIGLVPGGGDAAKRSMRAIKSGAVRPDELLDMIRRLYKGDPEKLLRDVLDVGKLRKHLDAILSNPHLTERVSPQVKRSIDDIRAGLNRQFDGFRHEVDGWLAKGRKTSAESGAPSRHAAGTPSAKPNTQAKAGTRSTEHHSNTASTNTPNAATQRNARFKSLTQKVLGVLGEHMADYHCQEVKGWGKPAAHDSAAINPAKLNDGGRLVQLWPCVPRGRGIDAVWKTHGAKPYAIIEAKVSYNPAKSLGALLGEAADKNEPGGTNASASGGRKGRSGAKGGTGGATGNVRQANGKVTQMSHGWIQARLQKAVDSPDDLNRLRRLLEAAYSRHVLLFSLPHAVDHAEALILHASQHHPDAHAHVAHGVTTEFLDDRISQVVSQRARPVDPASRRPR